MMRRVFFGLLFFSLTACSAFAGDASTPGPGAGGAPEKLSSVGQPQRPKNNKRVRRAQPLPLSSAGAYASEHPTALPNSPDPRPAAPSNNNWTGFYVGAGAGATQR
jgi:hypothetical protein